MMLLEDDDDKYWLYQAKFLDFLNKILPKKASYIIGSKGNMKNFII